MSNLIKSVYFNVKTEEKRVIDSEPQLEELLPEVYSSEKNTGNGTAFHKLSIEDMVVNKVPSEQPEEQEGFQVIKMDDVIAEERQKLSEETREEANQIIEDARNEAEQIIASAQDEANRVKEQAYEDGYREGMQKAGLESENILREKEALLENSYQQKLLDLQKEQAELEPHFAELTCALLHKITGALFEDKKEVIAYLIHQSVMGLEKTRYINVRVSKEDIAEISMKRKEWKEELSFEAEFEVTEDQSLKQGQCIIEADDRIIDCSLDTQLNNLCDQLRLLSLGE